MAQAETIKDFLVSLGFSIDPAGERRFLDSMAAATVKATMLGQAALDAATAVVSGVARIADNLEQLYFASQRTNAAAENIQAFGFAAKQMGVDAGAAQGAIESLARFLRNSPGGEGLLKNLGVHTRDANGHMRDTVDLLGDLGDKFAGMDYYKANAYAQALGIDEKTLMAMRQGMGQFSGEYKAMLKAAGVDSQEAAKSSHAFMVELRTLMASVSVLSMKVISGMTGGLTTNIRRLRETFVANFDRISATIKHVVGGVMHIADGIARLAIRGVQAINWLSDWFDNLPPGLQRIIEGIGGVLLAWRLLNAGFLATPIGMVVGLGLAIASLVDDYKTWKEGGKSLIDWSEWAPGIEEALKNLRVLGGELSKLADVLLKIFKPALSAIGDILGNAIKTGFGNLLDLVTLITDVLTGKWDAAGKKGEAIMRRMAGFAASTVDSIRKGVSGTIDNARASMSGGESSAPTVYSGSRGIRNNNPGNLNYGPFAREHGALGIEAGPGGRFARFASAQDGLNALADKLRDYMAHGKDSVKSIMETYAPPNENNTKAYIAFLAKRLGVDPTAHLDPRNVQQIAGLMDGIVRYENTKNPYSAEMVNRAAARGVGLTQSTTITVHASGDAKAIAQETASAQNNVNGQLVRNLRGAAF